MAQLRVPIAGTFWSGSVNLWQWTKRAAEAGPSVDTMVVLSRKPGEAVIVGRPSRAFEPWITVPPQLPMGGGPTGGAVGPAMCPAAARARRPLAAPPSRAGNETGPRSVGF
jgi:hypothetical protein